jgi:TetR/AcrR family transcriptional regulator, repressor for divergent bdcA
VTTTKTSKSPGRPRSFDMDRALDTAIRLFRSRGYDAVGVAELVSELGIKPPSFYAAFGSKAGLLERAIERYSAGEANVFERARDKGGSVAEVIERTLANAVRLYPEQGGLAGCLVLDGTRNSADSDARELTAAAKQAGYEELRKFIATEYPVQAARLARQLTISLAGMSAAARDGATRAELADFAETIGRAIQQEMKGRR